MIKLFWFSCLYLLSALCQALEYQVDLDAAAGRIVVSAKLADTTIAYLVNSEPQSQHALRNLSGLRLTRGRLYLAANHTGRVSYEVDLHHLAKRRRAKGTDQHWTVDNGSWLWRPNTASRLTIKFSLPDHQVSHPWKRSEYGYVVGQTPAQWTSRIAFGSIDKRAIETGNTSLMAAFVGFEAPQLPLLEQWLKRAADGVSRQYGRFPVETPQILVVNSQSAREPVPWGEVQRGGSPSAHYFVDIRHPRHKLLKDWTAYHELSHLFIPKINWRDRWISEGLATYFQNLTMVEMHTLSPQEAVAKLRQGLNRGRRASAGNPLRNARRTMHVYWGGAAIFILADLELHRRGNSLAEVLAHLNQCCMPSDESWTAERLMKQLDGLSDSEIFSSLLAKEAVATEFPMSKARFDKANSTGELNALLKPKALAIDSPSASL